MTDPKPERRCRRPTVSCTLCRKRKIRCNRETPCSNCMRASSTSKESTATNDHTSTEPHSSDASTPTTQSSASYVESIKSRIIQLEREQGKAIPTSIQSSPSTPNSSIETTTSQLGGIFHTRSFGQSHWINVVTSHYPELIKRIEPCFRDERSKIVLGIQRSKSLAKIIKARRAPSWPTISTAELPPKDVTDELIECYLRTSETIYHILHIPSFRRDYDAHWMSAAQSNTAFLVQLKRVLAIGAATYDEQFTLRAWLSQPNIKQQLGIQALQTSLTLPRSGKRGLYMGMHKDPARLPKMTTSAAEMRRKLWNTIIETTLQSSLTSGRPPFISVNDFDASPPGNFDEDQLATEDPLPKPEDHFTQASIAIALRKTFPLRLAVAKFLNDIGSHGTYEETLRLDGELRTSYKALCRTLQVWRSGTRSSPSQFELNLLDFLMHRYISALHIPFFVPALHEALYAWSRKVVIEPSLKIWYTLYPSASIMAAQSRSGIDSSDRDDLARLTVTGSVFYKTVAIQATILIAMELRAQLQEQESLSPLPLRPDLLSILEGTKDWCLRCIEVGETSIKDYLLTCVVAAQIDGLMQGLAEDDLTKLLIKAAEDAEDTCLPILEEMAARHQVEGEVGELHQMTSNTLPGNAGDWDFLMSDVPLNQGNADPMTWMFNDVLTQEPLLW
ncbi:hypothetical protein BDZ45DRAFT_708746 [Acephala macrosclerotiorum]|nr:hypothetical protein BDZ45DRAFT_708746 [Acephala macrosclerotiorum]